MSTKNDDAPKAETTSVGDHVRVARRADGSQYLVHVSGGELPEGFRTELENPTDVLLPVTVTP